MNAEQVREPPQELVFRTNDLQSDRNDRFPLHRAARLGQRDQIITLLKAGSRVNEVDWDQISPLHEACLYGHLDCAQLLLDHHALVNATNIDGATPLCEASAKGSSACIRLLLKHGALVNPPLSISSPLHEAVMAGDTASVQLLVDAGAKLDGSDCHYGTPLHVAAHKANGPCMFILLKAGAAVNAAKFHSTALHIVASNSHPIEVALLLLQFGADVHQRNNKGLTAKDLTPVNTMMYAVLYQYESHPRTLLEICRLQIRRLLSSKNLQYIYQLGLPQPLLKYLDYDQEWNSGSYLF